MAQILPGIDESLGPRIRELGETISLFTKTDRRTQRAIRDMLLQKPEMLQQFADIEKNAPGTLDQLGFGNLAGTISKTPESVEQELGRRTREDVVEGGVAATKGARIGAETELAGITEASDLLQKYAGLREDYARGLVNLPSMAGEQIEQLQIPPLAMQAQQAQIIMRNAERGEDVTGPLYNHVSAFRLGQDDPNTTSALLAHPILGQQFQLLYELQADREARMIRENTIEQQPTEISDLPVAIQQQFSAISPVRGSFNDYAEKVRAFMSLPTPERMEALFGGGSHQKELGELRSLQAGLMGTFRPILSPGPLSVADMRMLERMLGNVLSPASFIRGSTYVEGQLAGVDAFINSKITGLQSMYPSVEVPKIPISQVPPALILRLRDKEGLNAQQIEEKLVELGYDRGEIR